MGTPDFAVNSLEKIVGSKHDIIAVYTQPDRKKGRGQRLLPSPVKEAALKHNIDVFQPSSLRKKEEVEAFKNLKPDLCVVVAYGQILSQEVLDIPKYGCVNLHGSMLPLYRGAAPIQWSVINGDSKTGVTSMFMSKGLDEGDIILQKEILLDNDINSIELFEKMAPIGADLLLETIALIDNKNVKRIAQNSTGITPTFAPLLDKEIALIDFKKSALEIHNLIRGLIVWPVAYTKLNEVNLKIYKSKIVDYNDQNNCEIGELVDGKKFIVKCGNNSYIEFLTVQLSGKKQVSGTDFINGRRLTIHDKIY